MVADRRGTPFLLPFHDSVFYVDFMLNLAHFGLPFATLWLPFGSLWPPFGALWLTFGSLWPPFGSLLTSFGSLLVSPGHFFSYLYVFSTKVSYNIVFYFFSLKMFRHPISQNTCRLIEGSTLRKALFLCTASSPTWPGAEPWLCQLR